MKGYLRRPFPPDIFFCTDCFCPASPLLKFAFEFSIGGVTALVAAIILGPRMGRFYDMDGNLLDEPNDFPPHSVTLQFLGTFCLWFGWYGFNPGSTLAISTSENGDVASLVAVNTTLAACAGAVSAMFLSTLMDVHQVGIAQW